MDLGDSGAWEIVSTMTWKHQAPPGCLLVLVLTACPPDSVLIMVGIPGQSASWTSGLVLRSCTSYQLRERGHTSARLTCSRSRSLQAESKTLVLAHSPQQERFSWEVLRK